VSRKQHAPADLLAGGKTSTRSTEGCVGPRARLDVSEKGKKITPAKIRNTDLPDGSLVSTATQLSQVPLKGRSIAEVIDCRRHHVMTAMSTLETEALEVV
jgi:hypothetical protein